MVRKTEHLFFGGSESDVHSPEYEFQRLINIPIQGIPFMDEGERVRILKLMLRWMMNIPKGDVKMLPSSIEKADTQSASQSTQVLVQ